VSSIAGSRVQHARVLISAVYDHGDFNSAPHDRQRIRFVHGIHLHLNRCPPHSLLEGTEPVMERISRSQRWCRDAPAWLSWVSPGSILNRRLVAQVVRSWVGARFVGRSWMVQKST